MNGNTLYKSTIMIMRIYCTVYVIEIASRHPIDTNDEHNVNT